MSKADASRTATGVVRDSAAELIGLRSAVAGEVILPGTRRYAKARRLPSARFDGQFLDRLDRLRPRAIVLCRSEEDVVAAIAHARRRRLGIAVRSGGHCFAGSSSTDGVVADLSAMGSMSIRGDLVRVSAGASLGSVYDGLDERGLTLPAGSSPTVAIGGLTLGGGLGVLGRKHGLTCDQLLGLRVVLADGRVVDCDGERYDDLFWALRGAGREVGVVTSLLFRAVPAPQTTAFHLTWTYRHAIAMLECWQQWASEAPEELTASLLVTVPADVDEPPQVGVFGVALCSESQALPFFEDMAARVGAEPETVHIAAGPYRQTRPFLTGLADQLEGVDHMTSQALPAFSKSEFFRRALPADVIAALIANLASGRVRGEVREIDCMPWGGAYNRLPVDATAFPHRRERYLIKHTVALRPQPTQVQTDAARRWLRRSWHLTHPYGSGGVYANFPDPSIPDPCRAYYGPNLARVQAVKRRYDPDNVFGSVRSADRVETDTGR